MQMITIGKHIVIVDDDIAEDVNPSIWECRITRGRPYFRSVCRRGGVRKTIWLHRIIALCPKGLEVDHINNNPLDNRKKNLRICTKGDNLRNRGIRRINKSGVKGVYFSKVTNKWHAQIFSNGKKHHLGFFDDLDEASDAYDDAAVRFHGTFANLNRPTRRLLSQSQAH